MTVGQNLFDEEKQRRREAERLLPQFARPRRSSAPLLYPSHGQGTRVELESAQKLFTLRKNYIYSVRNFHDNRIKSMPLSSTDFVYGLSFSSCFECKPPPLLIDERSP